MLQRPDDVDAFARDAQPGDWATYGRGDHPPRELVRAMRGYVDAGVLVPTSKREAAGMVYLVKRGRGKMPARKAAASGQTWRRRSKTDLGRVLQCLVRAACRTLPCPSNCEIARRCGLSVRAARYRVEQLVKAGQIAADHDARTGWRVITILVGPHSGRSTMAAPGQQPPQMMTGAGE